MRALLLILLFHAGQAFAQDAAIVAERICQARPRLIGLGESEHNDDGQHLYKLALLEEIHSRRAVTALYFESPFTDAVLALLEHQPYGYFVYPFWKTRAVYPGLAGFIAKHKIIVAGFDPQENCSFRYFNRYLLEQGYIGAAVQATVQRTDSLLALAVAQQYGAKTRALSTTEADLLSTAQDTLIGELRRINKQPQYTPLLERCLENRKALARLLSYTRSQDKIRLREAVMAANIRFLQGYFAAGEEALTVVWAANRHIALHHAYGRKDDPPGMMALYAAGGTQRLCSTGIFPDKSATGAMVFDQVAFSGNKIRISGEEFNNYDCRR